MNINIIYLVAILYKLANDLDIKNKNLNVNINKDKRFLYLNLIGESTEILKLKINGEEKFEMSDFLISKEFCQNKKNNCIKSDFPCKQGSPKKASFKLFENQKGYFETKFCVLENNDKKSFYSPFQNILNEISYKSLKNFDLKTQLSFTDFTIIEDKNKQKIPNNILPNFPKIDEYESIKLTINPKIPKNDNKIDISNTTLILEVTDFKDIGNIKFEFEKIVLSNSIINAYDFLIYTNNKKLLNLNHQLNKNITFENSILSIKSRDKNNFFEDYNIKLNDINYKKKNKSIFFVESKNNFQLIMIGNNYLKNNNLYLVETITPHQPSQKLYKNWKVISTVKSTENSSKNSKEKSKKSNSLFIFLL